MSDYDLTDVDDVGPARADTIADAGFKDVDEVAYAPLDEFVDATGINEGTAEGIIASAADLVDEDEDGSAEEKEAVEEEADDGSDEDDAIVDEESEPTDDVESWITMDPDEYIGVEEASGSDVVVPVQMETRLLMHVIHITLEEATKKHQSSSYDNRNDAYSVSRKLMELVCDPDEYVDETVLLNQNELRSLYRAVSQGASNYASRSGIPKMWGELETFKKTVNDLR